MKVYTVGDSAKLREALKRLDELLYIGADGEVHSFIGKANEVERVIKDALAEATTGEDHSEVVCCPKSLKAADLRFDICRDIEQVLKIGRDYQNKDGYRGAHYDTVKLLCDAIEYQREQLKVKTEVGCSAKLREAVKAAVDKLMLWNYTDRDTAKMALGIMSILDAALDEPPRNCDIGTADEQRVGFEAWCEKQPERYCKACTECQTQRYAINCFCKWAQMPYKEKDGYEN